MYNVFVSAANKTGKISTEHSYSRCAACVDMSVRQAWQSAILLKYYYNTSVLVLHSST